MITLLSLLLRAISTGNAAHVAIGSYMKQAGTLPVVTNRHHHIAATCAKRHSMPTQRAVLLLGHCRIQQSLFAARLWHPLSHNTSAYKSCLDSSCAWYPMQSSRVCVQSAVCHPHVGYIEGSPDQLQLSAADWKRRKQPKSESLPQSQELRLEQLPHHSMEVETLPVTPPVH